MSRRMNGHWFPLNIAVAASLVLSPLYGWSAVDPQSSTTAAPAQTAPAPPQATPAPPQTTPQQAPDATPPGATPAADASQTPPPAPGSSVPKTVGGQPVANVKPGSINDVNAVGNRDIGARGVGNWYSTESEIKMGKGYAMEIEKSTKMINDPVITEYVNRIGQNMVKNSDARCRSRSR